MAVQDVPVALGVSVQELGRQAFSEPVVVPPKVVFTQPPVLPAQPHQLPLPFCKASSVGGLEGQPLVQRDEGRVGGGRHVSENFGL